MNCLFLFYWLSFFFFPLWSNLYQFINCSSFFYCLLSYWTFYIFFFCDCFYSLDSWILSSVGAKCHPTWGVPNKIFIFYVSYFNWCLFKVYYGPSLGSCSFTLDNFFFQNSAKLRMCIVCCRFFGFDLPLTTFKFCFEMLWPVNWLDFACIIIFCWVIVF